MQNFAVLCCRLDPVLSVVAVDDTENRSMRLKMRVGVVVRCSGTAAMSHNKLKRKKKKKKKN